MPASVVNNHRIIGGLFSFIQSWRPPVCNRFLERELCFCIRNANGGMHIAHVSSSNELVMLQWWCMCPMCTGGRWLLRNNFNQPNWCCYFVFDFVLDKSAIISNFASRPLSRSIKFNAIILSVYGFTNLCASAASCGTIIIKHHVRRRKKILITVQWGS